MSLLLAAALLVQGSGLSAMSYIKSARDKVSQMYQGSPLQDFLNRYIGQPTSQAAQNFMNWAGPFMSELSAAYKAGNYNAMSQIVEKYKAQSAAAGAVAATMIMIVVLVVKAIIGSGKNINFYLKDRNVDMTKAGNINFINTLIPKSGINYVESQRRINNYISNPMLINSVDRDVILAIMDFAEANNDVTLRKWAYQLYNLQTTGSADLSKTQEDVIFNN